MRPIHIFISSPGDVETEREFSKDVIKRLGKRRFGEDLELKPFLWEDLPLVAGESFQEGINRIIEDVRVDIAIFIVWARLGTPQGQLKEDNKTPYNSGTECEFDLMRRAREKSGEKVSDILFYRRVDSEGLKLRKLKLSTSEERAKFEDQERKLAEFVNDLEERNLHEEFRSYSTYDKPASFFRRLFNDLRSKLWQLAVREVSWDSQKKGSPYQGLEHFELEHSEIFYGRSEEVLEILDRLDQKTEDGCAFVLIVGGSGSGKSSLARAGVMADIQSQGEIDQWRCVDMVPGKGGDPIQRLAELIALSIPEIATNPSQFADGLRANPEESIETHLVNPLEESNQETRIVLLVDQFEELFAPQIRPESRTEFVAALDALARCGKLSVIATVRADFYERCHELPKLIEMKEGKGQYDLQLPRQSAIDSIIRKPAERAGFSFEYQEESNLELGDVIFEESVGQPEALPLVQVLLKSLFEACKENPNKMLTFDAFEKLGGVSGALNERAESVYLEAEGGSESRRQAFLEIMRRLVTIRDNNFVRVRALLSELIHIPDAEAMIEPFCEARLFVKDTDKEGRAIVTVAHEALFRRWSRYREWISANGEQLKSRSRLAEMISIWRENGYHQGYLLPVGKPMEDLEALAGAVRLTEEELLYAFLSSLLTDKKLPNVTDQIQELSEGKQERFLLMGLESESESMRSSAAEVAGDYPGRGVYLRLVDLAILDPSEKVREMCARSLGAIDALEAYDELKSRLEGSSNRKERQHAKEAFSRLLILSDGSLSVADREIRPSKFADKYKEADPKIRSEIRLMAWGARWKEAFSIIPIIVVPAMLLSGIGAASFKWIPGMYNYAICQGSESAATGLIHGLLGGIFWAGGIVAILAIYRVVFEKVHANPGTFRPFGTVVAGTIGGFFASMLISLVIYSVLEVQSLADAGWIRPDVERYSPQFFREVFLESRLGWGFVCLGIFLGMGIAAVGNTLRFSNKWRDFLGGLPAIWGGKELIQITRRATSLTFRYCLPLLLMIICGGVIEYFLCNPIGELSSWGNSPAEKDFFFALRVAGDCGTVFVGGFFAVVGMAVGSAIVRHGININPLAELPKAG